VSYAASADLGSVREWHGPDAEKFPCALIEIVTEVGIREAVHAAKTSHFLGQSNPKVIDLIMALLRRFVDVLVFGDLEPAPEIFTEWREAAVVSGADLPYLKR